MATEKQIAYIKTLIDSCRLTDAKMQKFCTKTSRAQWIYAEGIWLDSIGLPARSIDVEALQSPLEIAAMYNARIAELDNMKWIDISTSDASKWIDMLKVGILFIHDRYPFVK